MFCQKCGKQIPDGATFCPFCGAQQGHVADTPPQPEVQSETQNPQQTVRPAPQKQENVLLGIVGAFLGSLVGVVVMVILDRIGFVASISGVVMTLGAVWGYNRFGKALSTKSMIICVIIVAAMIYIGNMVCWAIALSEAFSYGFIDGVRAIPAHLANDSAFSEGYYATLLQQYLFAGVSAVVVIVKLVRENKKAK